MSKEYTKVFTNTYPSGWKNKPSESTPVTAAVLNNYTKTFMSIESYLYDNPLITSLNELTTDESHRTVTDDEKKSWNAKVNKSELPTRVGDLINNVGYATKITELKDVDIQNLVNGQILKWDAINLRWVNSYSGGGGGTAEETLYDNSKSGLKSTNVQDAIDELVIGILGGAS